MPFRIGMEISVTIRSGSNFPAASNRDLPSATLPTTSNMGSKIFSTIRSTLGGSSARTTRSLRILTVPFDETRDRLPQQLARESLFEDLEREHAGRDKGSPHLLLSVFVCEN